MPPGRLRFSVKRRPGAFTVIPGGSLETYFGAFGPRGRFEKPRKTHTHTHTSHTNTATTARQQQVLIMSQPSSTDKAPMTDKNTGDQSVSWGACVVLVKRRPRGKARRPHFPRLFLRWYSADQALAFAVRHL